MNDGTKKRSAWTNFWEQNFLTTFADNGASYNGEVLEFWNNAFELLDVDSFLVDLGSGNGALLKLAKEFFLNKKTCPDMVAVDSADISNSKFYQMNPDIELLGKTSIEDTGIESFSVGLCVSHFGFEYSLIESSVKELARILKPKGHFCAIIHNSNSTISNDSKSMVEQIKLCQRSKLAETGDQLIIRLNKLKNMNVDPAKDKKANELRQYFNGMSSRLIQYGDNFSDSSHIDYFLNELGRIFGVEAKKMTIEEKKSVLRKILHDSENYLIRSESMLDAAMSYDDFNNFLDLLNKENIKIQSKSEFINNGLIYGWAVTARKVD